MTLEASRAEAQAGGSVPEVHTAFALIETYTQRLFLLLVKTRRGRFLLSVIAAGFQKR